MLKHRLNVTAELFAKSEMANDYRVRAPLPPSPICLFLIFITSCKQPFFHLGFLILAAHDAFNAGKLTARKTSQDTLTSTLPPHLH